MHLSYHFVFAECIACFQWPMIAILDLLQTVKEFIEKVKAGGNKHVELFMYPGEGHGFMNGGEDIHKMMKSEYPLCLLLAVLNPVLTLVDLYSV